MRLGRAGWSHERRGRPDARAPPEPVDPGPSQEHYHSQDELFHSQAPEPVHSQDELFPVQDPVPEQSHDAENENSQSAAVHFIRTNQSPFT